MSDQEDFDRDLTPSQEHTIAFAVILLFGAMYLFFMKGCQPIASSIGQAFGPVQTEQVSASHGAVKSVSAQRSLATNTEDSRDGSEGSSDTESEGHANDDSVDETAQPHAVVNNEAAVAAEDNSAQADAQAQKDQERDTAKIKAEAASLAAATAAQKLADEERLKAKQAESKVADELAIPKKPIETASTSKPPETPTKEEPAGESPKEEQNKPFNKDTELARTQFTLPDGRKVSIPEQGFENSFKQSIVEGSSGSESIVFDRVYFYPGSDLLNPESSNQILGAAGIMNTYKDINVKLRGHTDSTGQAENNLTLSFKRSQNLKKQLVGLGIDANRIQVEGLGSTEPLSDNQSEKGRNKNRRIDLTIIR